jgi:catechol 2,3-dioxygenase-like lactoylglutathione lyase family enzyme
MLSSVDCITTTSQSEFSVHTPGGWNRIHLVVDNLPVEVARLRAAGVQFRNDIVIGPGGSQILLIDPSGNLVELFQPAPR